MILNSSNNNINILSDGAGVDDIHCKSIGLLKGRGLRGEHNCHDIIGSIDGAGVESWAEGCNSRCICFCNWWAGIVELEGIGLRNQEFQDQICVVVVWGDGQSGVQVHRVRVLGEEVASRCSEVVGGGRQGDELGRRGGQLEVVEGQIVVVDHSVGPDRTDRWHLDLQNAARGLEGQRCGCVYFESEVVPLVGGNVLYGLAVGVVELDVVVGGVDGVGQHPGVVDCGEHLIVVVHQLVCDQHAQGGGQAFGGGEGGDELVVEGEGQGHQQVIGGRDGVAEHEGEGELGHAAGVGVVDLHVSPEDSAGLSGQEQCE